MRSAVAVMVVVPCLLAFWAGSAAASPPNWQPACPPTVSGAWCAGDAYSDKKGGVKGDDKPVGLSPKALRRAYGFPNSPVNGRPTIGIVDAYDHPKIEDDLEKYSEQFNLPDCTFDNGCLRKVNQDGNRRPFPKKDPGWAFEIAIDVELAHGLCPKCKILLVEARSNSFADLAAAEDTAVALGADVVNNSWGGWEFSGQLDLDWHFNHPGIPIVASTGDDGFGVQWPSTSPTVTAVGGTTLVVGSDGSRQSETAWQWGGSGCSDFEPKPSWQLDDGCTTRTVADVAALADPSTGPAIYDSVKVFGVSGWLRVGGTSVAAPIVTSAYALAGDGGTADPGAFPYLHASSFFDVVSGSNGTCSPAYLCTAGAGYDGPTGLGTPNGLGGF